MQNQLAAAAAAANQLPVSYPLPSLGSLNPQELQVSGCRPSPLGGGSGTAMNK